MGKLRNDLPKQEISFLVTSRFAYYHIALLAYGTITNGMIRDFKPSFHGNWPWCTSVTMHDRPLYHLVMPAKLSLPSNTLRCAKHSWSGAVLDASFYTLANLSFDIGKPQYRHLHNAKTTTRKQKLSSGGFAKIPSLAIAERLVGRERIDWNRWSNASIENALTLLAPPKKCALTGMCHEVKRKTGCVED